MSNPRANGPANEPATDGGTERIETQAPQAPAGALSRTTTLAGAAGAAAGVLGGAAIAYAQDLGPFSTASPGPGEYNGGRVRFDRIGIGAEADYENFGCDVFRENPNTPDWATANAYFERGIHNVDIEMHDGEEVRCWAFEDELKAKGREIFPSPMIRVQEGDLVHVKLESSKGSHTIHSHGIEPTTMNDGVGHVSFEVKGDYVYQWQASSAGTYFYHCHKNTVTHFEMGLYGLLIVDPKPDPDGRVRAYKDGPHYDKEAFWVLDDIDPRWHESTDIDHDVGLCGEDAGLNIFEPKYFLLTGTPARPREVVREHRVVARNGEVVLVRLLNAAYSLLEVTIEEIEAQVISVDGRSLDKPWNGWFPVGRGEPFIPGTAQRYDLLIDPNSPANRGKTGAFRVEFAFRDWVTREIHNAGDPDYEGRIRTVIRL
jgi:plastocyanin